jgi:hypothetical protein
MGMVFDYDQLRTAADALGWQVEMMSALSKKEVSTNPFWLNMCFRVLTSPLLQTSIAAVKSAISQ